MPAMTTRWDDRDITGNRHGGNEFSQAAHDSIRPTKAEGRRRVKAAIRELGAATSDDVTATYGLPHQTTSARFSELKADREIVQVGRRRTRTGHWAAVYAVAEDAQPPPTPTRPPVPTRTGPATQGTML